MNCRKARALIHDLLDGESPDQRGLDAHVESCGECRQHLALLRRVHSVTVEALDEEVEDARLEHATARILQAVRQQGSRLPASGALRRTLGAFAALLIFGLGTIAGRAVWPREVVVTKVVPRRVVVEKEVIVEVPTVVEIVREVVREVPVYRTKVVYRDAPAPAPVVSQPEKAPEIVLELDPVVLAADPIISHELHPVTVVDPEADKAASAGPTSPTRSASVDGSVGESVLVAQSY